MKLTSRAELILFADCLAIPREMSVPFSTKVANMYKSSGTDWTVSFLKTVYQDFVRFCAGQPLVGTWYRKGKDGLPSGPFRPFFLAKTRKERFRAAQYLRCYTGSISKTLTEKQWSKFIDGVSAKPVPLFECDREMLQKACDKLKLSLQYGFPKPYYSYAPSESRFVPDPAGTSEPEREQWMNQHRISKTVLGQFFIRKYEPLFSRVLPHNLDFEIDENFPQVVGRIGLIQEPGLKLRAIANPNRIFQQALQPLGDSLYNLLRKLPWDCTHDQEFSFPIIQEHLKQQREVFCVDLTGATDYFPLHLQEVILKHITLKDTGGQINLFLDLSRSPWLVPGGQTLVWSKGQPLGLYPSFASFALSHGLVLYSLNDFRHEDKFFILGDDVVILDKGLHSRYVDFLQRYECPISTSKSINSTLLAEFGGKLITKFDIIPQLKWRQVSDDNFLDILKNIGPSAGRLLRSDQRKIVDLVSFIPEFLGGLGYNPKGLPLELRYEMYLNLIQPDRSSYLLSLSKRVTDYIYNSKNDCVLWTDSFLRDFDQKSALLTLNLLRFVDFPSPVMGRNLNTVFPDLGLPKESKVSGF